MLEAFQAAALKVDRDINAVCDFILEARTWALQLEAVPETERGALYGLPFSVKVKLSVADWSDLIGRACPYTVLPLVEPYTMLLPKSFSCPNRLILPYLCWGRNSTL